MSHKAPVVVIGAGLSGLYAAWRLQQQNIPCVVLEARDRVGGRILSPQINHHNLSAIDLGPAWVWPEFQPRMAKLLETLDVGLFKQYTQGELLFEPGHGQIQRHAGPSSHEQSYRIEGGAGALINSLLNKLDESTVQLNCQVNAIEFDTHTIDYQNNGHNAQIQFSRIILALPLRLAAQSIRFVPQLPEEIKQHWMSVPTWMASHCKMVFVYEQAFWRQQNLSGEVFSYVGPLTEIYDGSSVDDTVYALTSFVGLNAHQRKQAGEKRFNSGSETTFVTTVWGAKRKDLSDSC